MSRSSKSRSSAGCWRCSLCAVDFVWLRNWCFWLGSCGEKNGAGDGEGSVVVSVVGRFGVLNVCRLFGSTVFC